MASDRWFTFVLGVMTVFPLQLSCEGGLKFHPTDAGPDSSDGGLAGAMSPPGGYAGGAGSFGKGGTPGNSTGGRPTGPGAGGAAPGWSGGAGIGGETVGASGGMAGGGNGTNAGGSGGANSFGGAGGMRGNGGVTASGGGGSGIANTGSGGAVTGAGGTVQDAGADVANDDGAILDAGGDGMAKLAAGTSCSSGSQCQSGSCPDGICCVESCGPCSDCKGAGGTCINVLAWSPDTTTAPECGGGGYACNGLGKCLKGLGAPCQINAECISDYCRSSSGTCHCGDPGTSCCPPDRACNAGSVCDMLSGVLGVCRL